MTPRAWPGWLTMSPSEISPVPVGAVSVPAPTGAYPMSVAPVIIPHGEVPATPSLRMLA